MSIVGLKHRLGPANCNSLPGSEFDGAQSNHGHSTQKSKTQEGGCVFRVPSFQNREEPSYERQQGRTRKWLALT